MKNQKDSNELFLANEKLAFQNVEKKNRAKEYSILNKEDFIEFYVKDTGIGIAPENLELIFERFRQVNATDNHIHGGNGLGLSISKALIEKLGGTITVKSKLGIGSTILFTIPYLKESDIKLHPHTENKFRRFTGGAGKTILIVEDEVNNYAYIEEILSSSKVTIVHAWEGSEAVEYVKNNADISLVLMDIKMRKMNGYEALRLIKQIRPGLPVIAQTAYALSQDKNQTLQEGFDNYISKPIAKNTLVDIITGYLN
ncbi:MAG TPA: response regulator [Bacteroidales bacterium]